MLVTVGTKGDWCNGPLYYVCVMSMCCSFLMSIEGGLKNSSTATQEATDLSKLLYSTDTTKCEMRQASHMPNVVGYLNRLRECKVGPSGQITKLSILTNTLKMLGSRLPEDGGSEEDRAFVVRAKIIEAKIQSLQKTLRKESQSLRRHKKVLELIDFHCMLKVHQNIQ